jgi:hypothetical protein
MRRNLAILLLLLLFAGASRAGQPAIGTAIKNLTFKDIWYLPRSLDDFGDRKAYAIVIATIDSLRGGQWLPKLKALDEKYRDQGVQFLAINVGPDDSIRRIADQALEQEIKFPFVKDVAGTVAAELGIAETPAVVLLDAHRLLRYRGRIESHDQPPAPALAAAMDDLLADRPIQTPETPIAGEPIKRIQPISNAQSVTFAEHIAPILQKRCQHCHRPGTEAPFALIGYDDAVAHADTIAEVVAEERMPPWYASFGDFANDPSLSAGEKQLVAAWVASGSPAGDLGRLPPPEPSLVHPRQWAIEDPDVVITVPQVHELPASGYVPYKYVILPYRFQHDTWIQQCEILPDNPRVVHHCNMAYLENALDWQNAKFVLGRVPGVQPMLLNEHVAFRIPKGAILILQIHYTTTGQPEKCQISVGMRYAREVVHKEFHFLWMVNNEFAIPPGEPLHRVAATTPLECDAIGAGLFAHMHLRGRDMTFVAHYPDGRAERLLTIPNYSFDWQLAYRWPTGVKRFPKGTRIECISHYDNSKFNPYNPDPAATVREGQQTFQEMLNGVMFYVSEEEHLNLRIDPKTGAVIEQSAQAPPARQ